MLEIAKAISDFGALIVLTGLLVMAHRAFITRSWRKEDERDKSHQELQKKFQDFQTECRERAYPIMEACSAALDRNTDALKLLISRK